MFDTVEVHLGKNHLLTKSQGNITCDPSYPFQLPALPGTVSLIHDAPVIPADERLRIKIKWPEPLSNLLGITCTNEEELTVLLERRKYIDLRMMTDNVEALPADTTDWLWLGQRRAEKEGPLCLALVRLVEDSVEVLGQVHFHLLKTDLVQHPDGLLSEDSLLPADDHSSAMLASHVRIKQLLDDDADMLKDDGPVFLAAVQQIEKSIDGFRRQVKLLLRALQAWMESQEACEEKWSTLFDCILDTACLETSLPYLSKAWPQEATHRNVIRMQVKHEFIDPLLRLYEHEIKVADMRRREFEDAAAAYHAYEARYLKKDAAAPASRSRLRDSKYHARRSEYELKRMEYWSFLQDLQLAQSHRVNALLVKFLELLQTSPTPDPEAEHAWQSLHRMVTIMSMEIDRRLEEREQRHKLLEDSHDEAIIRLRLEHMGVQSNEEASTVKADETADCHQREGFLNVMRPDQRSFKRYWCVLAAGQVFEYSIDRERRLKLSEVFSLENSTVREARDQDRRFCLEAINPQHNPARLYQARGEEERARWLRALQAAAVSWIDGSRSPTEAERLPMTLQRWSSIDGNGEDSESVGMQSPRTTRSPSLTTSSLHNFLEELRLADELNRVCADCGRPNPEWISINLGVIICIECSGIHRSLGSHISKVRSLTLDTAAFTPSLQQRIRAQGGNLRMNAYYEARLGVPEVGPAPLKPDPASPHAVKEQFIRAKYEKLLWVPAPTDINRSSLDDLLFLSDNEK